MFDRRIIIATGAKGSCGKSTALLQIVDWLRDKKSKPILAVFDPDTAHKTLGRTFGPEGAHPLQPPHVFERIDWRGEDGQVVIDRVVRILFSNGESHPVISIVDGVANQMGDVLQWAKLVHLFELGEELGFRVTFLLCVNDSRDTADAASHLLAAVGGKADYIVVRTCGAIMGENGLKLKNLPWDSMQAKKTASDLGAIEVTIPEFTTDVKSYTQGMVDSQPHSILATVYQTHDTIMARRALSYWDIISEQLNKTEKLLLPPQHWLENQE